MHHCTDTVSNVECEIAPEVTVILRDCVVCCGVIWEPLYELHPEIPKTTADKNPIITNNEATARRRLPNPTPAKSRPGRANATADAVWVAADGVAVMLTVEDPEAELTNCEPTLHVRPVGALQEIVNGPRKFPTGDAVTEKVAVWPAEMVTLGGVAEIEKSGWAPEVFKVIAAKSPFVPPVRPAVRYSVLALSILPSPKIRL